MILLWILFICSSSRISDHRERIQMQASGKLQTAPGCTYDFTSDDLQDFGEIGRGAYGAVNKMVFRLTNTTMAGKRTIVKLYHSTMFQIGSIKNYLI